MVSVESTREKQLAWLSAIAHEKNWNISQLAKEAGVDPSTLSKFKNNPDPNHTLNTRTVAKLEAAAGFGPPSALPVQSSRFSGGLRESDAVPFAHRALSPDRQISSESAIDGLIEAAIASGNAIDPWILKSEALINAGYFPGDVLLVDLNGTPKDNDVVCAQLYSRTGRAETIFRLLIKPYLIAASHNTALLKPILVDDDNVVIRGVVTASIRRRLPH